MTHPQPSAARCAPPLPIEISGARIWLRIDRQLVAEVQRHKRARAVAAERVSYGPAP